MNIPQSTVAKPLTAIDYCAALEACDTIATVREFSEQCPLWVRQDERFAKAVAVRLAVVAERRSAA